MNGNLSNELSFRLCNQILWVKVGHSCYLEEPNLFSVVNFCSLVLLIQKLFQILFCYSLLNLTILVSSVPFKFSRELYEVKLIPFVSFYLQFLIFLFYFLFDKEILKILFSNLLVLLLLLYLYFHYQQLFVNLQC